LLNIGLFGATGQQWRDASPTLKGYMRDHPNMHQSASVPGKFRVDECVLHSRRCNSIDSPAKTQRFGGVTNDHIAEDIDREVFSMNP
jgi:hypothetical protein